MTVQRRLPILVISIAVIPLLILSVIIYRFSIQTSDNNYSLYLDNLSTAVSLQIDDYYKTQTKAILNSKEVSAYRELLEQSQGELPSASASYKEASSLLKTARKTDAYLSASILTNTEGVIVCASDESYQGGNISQFDYFKDCLMAEDCFWKLEKNENGNAIVVMGAPIKDGNGIVLGTIINYLNMEYLNSSIHNYKIGETGYLYVLDKQGQTLSHYYQNRMGKDYLQTEKNSPLTKLVKNLKNNTLKSDTGFVDYEIKGEHITANYQVVEGTGWLVIAAITTKEVYQEAVQSAFLIIFIALIVGTLSVFLGLKTANSVIRPLLYLSEKINGIANHDLSLRCEYKGKDEFKELFENVNSMADNLEKSHNLLKKRALTDTLTDMPNRHAISTIMHSEFNSKCGQAAIMMDLNEFKAINDTFGHDMGDAVLIQVAKILTQFEAETYHFSRLGGDEFFCFVSHYTQKKEILAIMEEIHEKIGRISEIDGKEITLSASIGIAFATDEAKYEMLVKKADIAMYEAKEKKNSVKYIVYDSDRA